MDGVGIYLHLSTKFMQMIPLVSIPVVLSKMMLFSYHYLSGLVHSTSGGKVGSNKQKRAGYILSRRPASHHASGDS